MTETQWLNGTDLGAMLQLLRDRRLVSHRKMRLFGCACCRRLWHLLADERCHRAVEVAEQYADRTASKKDLKASRAVARQVPDALSREMRPRFTGHTDQGIDLQSARLWATWAVWSATRKRGVVAGTAAAYNMQWAAGHLAARDAHHVHRPFWLRLLISNATRLDAAADAGRTQEQAAQCALLRDIFAPPFRLPVLDPAWLAWHDGTVPRVAQTLYQERAFDCLAVLADALEDAGCTSIDLLSHLQSPGPHVPGCWVLDLLLGRQ